MFLQLLKRLPWVLEMKKLARKTSCCFTCPCANLPCACVEVGAWPLPKTPLKSQIRVQDERGRAEVHSRLLCVRAQPSLSHLGHRLLCHGGKCASPWACPQFAQHPVTRCVFLPAPRCPCLRAGPGSCRAAARCAGTSLAPWTTTSSRMTLTTC